MRSPQMRGIPQSPSGGRSMSDVVERAKAALEGVTEGPWHSTGGVVWCVDVIAVPDPSDPTGQTPMPQQVQEKVCDTSEGDAEFIAAARTLVPELVVEVEKWRAAAVFAHDDHGALQSMKAERDEALAEIERLRSARTITTVEQLDALPDGAVIHVPHKLTASSVEKRHERWWPNCAKGPYHHGFRDELLPALLIWSPDWEAQA